jgi:hypothetical protein
MLALFPLQNTNEESNLLIRLIITLSLKQCLSIIRNTYNHITCQFCPTCPEFIFYTFALEIKIKIPLWE